MSVNTDQLEAGVRRLGLELGYRLGAAFVDRAQSNASRRTGALADSIQAESPVASATSVRVRAFVGVDYGRYQDEGTGIYGPEGVPITPRNARVLRFDWPAAGGIVFARSVRGSEPTRFWQRTIIEWPLVVSAV